MAESSEKPEQPGGGVKPKELALGIVLGLVVNGLYDVIKAVLVGGIPDFRINFDIKPWALLLSPLGGFIIGGMIAGAMESKEKPINLDSKTAWLLIAIGTVAAYLLLKQLFS